MVEAAEFRLFALTFKDVLEMPHFERTSFRLKQKIFATLDKDGLQATLRLSLQDQAEVLFRFAESFRAVAGTWGTKGWTLLDLETVEVQTMQDALLMAYQNLIRGNKRIQKTTFRIVD